MADTNLGTYSPEEIQAVISVGDIIHTVSGYMDGTFINISREVPAATLYNGADNSGARTLRSNKNATITLSLHQSSATNDILTQLYNNDQDARDNTWLFSVLIKDNSGRSIYQANQCFIGELPDSSFSTEIDTRDWTIQARNLEQKLGGNAEFSPDAEATLSELGGDIDPRFSSNQ